MHCDWTRSIFWELRSPSTNDWSTLFELCSALCVGQEKNFSCAHFHILRVHLVYASWSPPKERQGWNRYLYLSSIWNDSVGFFFSPVTIKLLQRIRTKTSFDQFCIRFIRIYRLLWSSARVRNELLTNHRRDIKTQGEGRWTRQGWIYPMFDVIRHIFTIPLQNQRNSKGENDVMQTNLNVTWQTISHKTKFYFRMLLMINIQGGPKKNNTENMYSIHNQINTCISSKCKSL